MVPKVTGLSPVSRPRDVSLFGLNMPHLHTEPGQHDLTASAYIVRLDTEKPTLMLHKHKKLKKFLQFGGHVEHDENPWDAITHELLEESGYEMSQLKVLQPRKRLKKLNADSWLHPAPVSVSTHKFEGLDHYHTDIAFAFTADRPPKNSTADGESDIIKLFTVAELKTLNNNKLPEDVREIGLFVLEECLPNWEMVAAT